jgi:hypothetical protein
VRKCRRTCLQNPRISPKPLFLIDDDVTSEEDDDEEDEDEEGEEVGNSYKRRFTNSAAERANKKAKSDHLFLDSKLKVGDRVRIGWPEEYFDGVVIAMQNATLSFDSLLNDSNTNGFPDGQETCGRLIRFDDGDILHLPLHPAKEVPANNVRFGEWSCL